jgi:hypothetical protein
MRRPLLRISARNLLASAAIAEAFLSYGRGRVYAETICKLTFIDAMNFIAPWRRVQRISLPTRRRELFAPYYDVRSLGQYQVRSHRALPTLPAPNCLNELPGNQNAKSKYFAEEDTKKQPFFGRSLEMLFSTVYTRVSSERPRLKAFCRVAPSVRFSFLAILPAGVFFRASDLSV